MPDQPSQRREFLGVAALGSLVAALGTAIAGVFRLPKPTVLPGPRRLYRLGDPTRFAVGSVTRLEAEQMFLIRGEKGFHAISSTCTHLGCIVAQDENGAFACPCHGSKFSPDGTVVGGPAPIGLPWLEVSLSPDGQLQVNSDNEVPRGTRFEV